MKKPTGHLVYVVGLLAMVALPGMGAAGNPQKTVTNLIGKLEKADDRLQAVQDLAELGSQAAPAVPDLIKLLHVQDEGLRVNVALALGQVGKPAVPPLVKALVSKDDDVRFYAVWALGLVGTDAQDATPAVVAALGDPVASVRRKAAFTLGRLGVNPDMVVPPLVKALDDADEDVREAVADTLTRLGEPAVPGLIRAIQDGPARARRHAVLIVGAIGPHASAAIPALRSLLLGNEADATIVAANALVGIGKQAIPALASGLQDDRPKIQQISFTALARFGSAASPAFADALKALASKDVSLRIELAGQIIESGVPVEDAVPILLAAMKEKDSGVRLRATQWLQRTHFSTRVSDKSVVLALGAVLQDEDARVGHTAADTLQRLGASAGPATPQLRKALASSTPGTRGCAFLALKTVDNDFENTAQSAGGQQGCPHAHSYCGPHCHHGNESR